jgi:hypothetical protein
MRVRPEIDNRGEPLSIADAELLQHAEELFDKTDGQQFVE